MGVHIFMCVEYVFIRTCMIVCASVYISTQTHTYGVATIIGSLKLSVTCLVDVRIFVCECLGMCTRIRVCIIVYIYTQTCADKLLDRHACTPRCSRMFICVEMANTCAIDAHIIMYIHAGA